RARLRREHVVVVRGGVAVEERNLLLLVLCFILRRGGHVLGCSVCCLTCPSTRPTLVVTNTTRSALSSPPPLSGEGHGGGMHQHPFCQASPLPIPTPQAGEEAYRVYGEGARCHDSCAGGEFAHRRHQLLRRLVGDIVLGVDRRPFDAGVVARSRDDLGRVAVR